jgi:hypothetical protein
MGISNRFHPSPLRWPGLRTTLKRNSHCSLQSSIRRLHTFFTMSPSAITFSGELVQSKPLLPYITKMSYLKTGSMVGARRKDWNPTPSVLRPQPPSRKTKDCPSASLHHMSLKRVMVMLGALRVRLRERGCRGRWWRGGLGPVNVSLGLE